MMEPTPENRAAPGESAEPAETPSPGKMLREARERLGMTVADVSGQTKLAVRQIEALEADDFRNLPEMAFVRGFVRSYAKILQLDAQPLLAALPLTNAPRMQLEPLSVEAPFPAAHSPQRQNLIWLGAALLLSVLVVAFAVWHFTAPPAKSGAAPVVAQTVAPAPLPAGAEIVPAAPADRAEAQPAETAAQAPARVAQPDAAGSGTVPPVEPQAQPEVQQDVPMRAAVLRLKFGEESWVEVKDRDGKVLSSQINPRGSELRLDGQAPFALLIGHAATVRLYHRGKRVDLTPHINPENEVARLTLE